MKKDTNIPMENLKQKGDMTAMFRREKRITAHKRLKLNIFYWTKPVFESMPFF